MRKHLIFVLFIFWILSTKGQSNRLDNNSGFDFAKLGQHIDSVKTNIDFYPYKCTYCDATDSIAKKYEVKSRDRLIINGVSTDRQNTLYFVENKLYKMDLTFSNNEIFQNKLYEYFVSEFGKETKTDGSYKIWDTKNAFLKMYHPTFKKDNRSTHYTSFEIFSKELDNLRNQKLEDLNDKNQSVAEKFKEDRKGKGNGTFKPDISYTLKLFETSATRSQLEKLLPDFKVVDTLATVYKYNEKTNNHDLLDELKSKYRFMYNSDFMVYMEVYSKNNKISKIDYSFDEEQNIEELIKQIVENNFTLDERLTRVISKLGFNNCFVFTKSPSYNFTIYSDQRFSISQ